MHVSRGSEIISDNFSHRSFISHLSVMKRLWLKLSWRNLFCCQEHFQSNKATSCLLGLFTVYSCETTCCDTVFSYAWSISETSYLSIYSRVFAYWKLSAPTISTAVCYKGRGTVQYQPYCVVSFKKCKIWTKTWGGFA